MARSSRGEVRVLVSWIDRAAAWCINRLGRYDELILKQYRNDLHEKCEIPVLTL